MEEAEVADQDALTPTNLIDKMRADEDTYKIFYERFVRCIVGKKTFDYKVSKADESTQEKTVVTTSDEALALLAFENGYENWADVWSRSDGKVRAVRKTEDYPKEWITDVPTKYTTRTDANGKSKGNADRSWSSDGIKRFNELMKSVAKNRRKYPGFFASFIGTAQDIIAQKAVRHETSKEASMPDAIHELFHDPESSREAFSPAKPSGPSKENETNDYLDDSD